MNKRPLKIAVMFSVIVFVVLNITMFLAVTLTMLFYRMGISQNANLEITLLVFSFVSIIIGTILSRVAGKHTIDKIIEISKATKEVAKGNFNINLCEDIRAVEIRTMAHNFNVMARELAGTEMLRNDFVENVSHEFKTPLSAIDGYAMLLQKKGLTEEKRIEYTDKILFNTKRLSTLTGNILLLSRLENQEIEITKEIYSLDEQLRECILLFEPQWYTKNINLDIELDSVNYYGNKELLAQVWQNILGNAMKFVSDNGRIRVILQQEENTISVSVADNGIGMSADIIQLIYEKFYQGDPNRATPGNGLGLTLVKRIVDLHKGEITVSSKEKKGTSFTVTLPIISPQQ